MVIDFSLSSPYKSFATNTALFPRKVDEDFESPELVPALNMNKRRDGIGPHLRYGSLLPGDGKAGIDLKR